SNNEAYERPQAVMHATLPPELYAFLTPSATRFDRPLLAAPDDPLGGYAPAPVPPPTAVDLRRAPPAPSGIEERVRPPETGAASNQWAAAASRTSGRGALLANDPHLELRLPPPSYRAELYWPGGTARGLSLPGLPGVVRGAPDTPARGAAVSNAGQSAWVVVEAVEGNPGRDRTASGDEAFEIVRHRIDVAGESPIEIETRVTRWGPVVG